VDKESLIHKLTLLDTKSYRCIKMVKMENLGDISVDIKEPPQYHIVNIRHKLYNVYKELTLEQLNALHHIRNNLER
tara:strand:- start:1276 stop:1503 length:228 start_codon:yes stop_codon:yes gene_type:complete